MSPPKKLPGELRSSGGRLIALVLYCVLVLVQSPFGYVFWLIEQRKAQIQDRLEQEAALQ